MLAVRIKTQQVERGDGLCASAILSPNVYYIRDAVKDTRTLSNPLVAGALGLRFYAAAPLRTHDGFNLGTLCVIDREPRNLSPAEAETLTKLSALVMDEMELRLAARRVAEREEVERRTGEQLRELSATLTASEERFRDLFDEAPIAYVHEDLETRFVRANRAAMRILGLSPNDISETFGKLLVPNTDEAQTRLSHVLDAIERRIETSGAILELRRKDNAKPVWIEWWSKPATDGNYTRTMFLDITGRVLSEQAQARLEPETAYLVDEIRRQHNFGDMIGESSGIRKVIEQVQLVAPSDASVLITGESGTGKELVARAIHEHSTRKGRAFIKVNCSAVPDSLFESEFFGHVKGAFTGALRDKPGRFELELGQTLEAACADRSQLQARFETVCRPLERLFGEQSFIGGGQTNYSDYVVFSAFQWARLGSPHDVVKPETALARWRSRMITLFDGLADKFSPYPTSGQAG